MFFEKEELLYSLYALCVTGVYEQSQSFACGLGEKHEIAGIFICES